MAIPQDYIIQQMYVVLNHATSKVTIGHNHTYRHRPAEISKKLPVLFMDFVNSRRDTEEEEMEVTVDVFYLALEEEARLLYPQIRLALGNIEQILIDEWDLNRYAVGGLVESETAQAAISLGKQGELEPTWFSGGVVRVTYRLLDLDMNRASPPAKTPGLWEE